MTITQQPQVKYRKDYLPSNYLIDDIHLKIELGEEETKIFSTLQVRINPDVKQPTHTLILNGESQTLKSVRLNDVLLNENQYHSNDETLTLLNVPEQLTLQIESTIKPQENISLEGLYRSNHIFCTQCEAEGFRRITYFLDRPDILSLYTTTIIADEKRYPVLLSNGNPIDRGHLPDGRHWTTWQDPFKKPCYLFAMVAGDLDKLEDHFTTCSGKEVTLRIFSEKGYKEKCQFAMEALKKAFKWDEEQYGREYDLDIFMLVAINDFNYGAMENKGLNIFNAKYIYADAKIATDADYQRLTTVVAHEYFHNWTGNRVTCRDWFQLSLKEGLTVFRDHTFSEDVGSYGVVRINEVENLRHIQFPEDAGPLAHPVRPDAYLEINNFYTATVYEKGAEVIRMIRTLLGRPLFRKGMDLYFKRHDGEAVTCDDFVQAMQDASGIDLTQFKLWYSQAGTPELRVTTHYDESKKQYHITVKQTCPPTPNQEEKLPMHMPLAVALLDPDGHLLPLHLLDQTSLPKTSYILDINKPQETFTLTDIPYRPVPSLLRDFSAPVKLHYDYMDKELAFLIEHDQDAFAAQEAMQTYARRMILNLMNDFQNNQTLTLPQDFIQAFKKVLLNKTRDKALIAYMINPPSENYIAQFITPINVDAVHTAREFFKTTIVRELQSDFKNIYDENCIEAPYEYNTTEVAKRSLKNICLTYLLQLNVQDTWQIAQQQFETANNMTDQLAALSTLTNTDCPKRSSILDQFYEQWKHERLVIDKWFAVQAISKREDTLQTITTLLKHPAFNLKNPNRVYSLLVSFFQNNPVRFHDITGAGYQLLTDQIFQIDAFNPLVAAKLVKALTRWRFFDEQRKNLMYAQLERLLAHPDLSKNVYEIVSKSIKE
jgi:aminopeptidase N